MILQMLKLVEKHVYRKVLCWKEKYALEELLLLLLLSLLYFNQNVSLNKLQLQIRN